MFGDHSTCNINWCKYLQKCGPNLQHVMPYSHSTMKKDLSDPELFTALSDIIEYYGKNASKLAPGYSTNNNESANSLYIVQLPLQLFSKDFLVQFIRF